MSGFDELDKRQEERLRHVDALEKRDREKNAEKWARPAPVQTPDEVEQDVKKIIEDAKNTPRRSHSYFDPLHGWVAPEDGFETNTYGSLKDISAALRNVEKKGVIAPDDLYGTVERLLFKYENFIQQSVRQDFGKRHGVSWYLVDKYDAGNRYALISYQDGPRAEWVNGCYADELPLWLLMGLFRRIQRRKPLGDQEADDTIAAVESLDAEYVQAQHDKHRPHLNIVPHRGNGDE